MSFPKISKAMDGLREAHREVLVAVFGKDIPALRTPKTRGTKSERCIPILKKPDAGTMASQYPQLPDTSG
jgi:hypothetical protein